MKKWAAKITALLLTAAIAVGLCSVCPFAAKAADADTISVTKTSGDLTFTIEYPKNIRCGEEMKFVLTGECDDAPYGFGYYQSSIYMLVNGASVYVMDVSQSGGVQSDNVYPFTFYAPGTYSFRYILHKLKYHELTGKVGPSGDSVTINLTVTVQDNDPNYPSIEKIVNNVAAECVALYPDGSENCDYNRALYMHDWILNRCDYDYTYSYCGPEGALARGLGTCEAYHAAYCLLLNKVGIQTGRIQGNGHVWTAVKMDGNWYQVDLTWDASSYAKHSGATNDKYELHKYFGITDEMMTLAHSDHSPVAGYESNSLDCNYYVMSGDADMWAAPYLELAENKAEGEDLQLTAYVNDYPSNTYTGYMVYEPYYKYIYPSVAHVLSKKTVTTSNGTEYALSAVYDDSDHSIKISLNEIEVDYTVYVKLPSGYGETNIWVDGVEYKNTTHQAGFAIAELADGNGKVAQMYCYNPDGTIGMYAWRLRFVDGCYESETLPEFQDLLSYHGFSIRITGKSGLRYRGGIDTTLKSTLLTSGVKGYKLTELGNGYIPAAVFEAGYPFVLGGTNTTFATALTTSGGKVTSDAVFETINGRAIFTNTLVGIPADYYDYSYCLRSYAKLSCDGDEIVIYGAPVTRSIYYVAKQLMNTSWANEGSAGYDYVKNIIDTVEQTANS